MLTTKPRDERWFVLSWNGCAELVERQEGPVGPVQSDLQVTATPGSSRTWPPSSVWSPWRARPRVAVDFDGVLADLVGAVCQAHQERYGWYPSWTRYSPPAGSPLAQVLADFVADERHLERVLPYPDLHTLRGQPPPALRLMVVSARSSRDQVVRWLEVWQLGSWFEEVVCCGDEERKLDLVVSQCDALIDDHEDLVACVPGLSVLVSRPWNRTSRHRPQVHSFAQALGYLEGYYAARDAADR